MKQKDVVVGGMYLTYIGQVLARVVVMQERAPIPGYSGSKHIRYAIRRENEDRVLPKFRTAAALRPLPTPKQPDVYGLNTGLSEHIGLPVGPMRENVSANKDMFTQEEPYAEDRGN